MACEGSFLATLYGAEGSVQSRALLQHKRICFAPCDRYTELSNTFNEVPQAPRVFGLYPKVGRDVTT